MNGGERPRIEFPCDYPIKIVGDAGEDFRVLVETIVERHAPDYRGETMEMRRSREGKYLSITCTVNARSREQLDGLYRELSAHEGVIMVL